MKSPQICLQRMMHGAGGPHYFRETLHFVHVDGRKATPAELMAHGFHVKPDDVDLVATLVAQQLAVWSGEIKQITGRERT